MPNLDGTGPMGQGPITGRKRGRCNDKQTEKSENKPLENKETKYGLGFRREFPKGNQVRGQGSRNRRSGKGFGRKISDDNYENSNTING